MNADGFDTFCFTYFKVWKTIFEKALFINEDMNVD